MRFVNEQKYFMTNRVEIIFSPGLLAPLFQQVVLFHPGMTVEDALNQTTLYSEFPEAKCFSVGIFSKKVELNTILSKGDRIEIYRALACNPKERRRKKALSTKSLR